MIKAYDAQQHEVTVDVHGSSLCGISPHQVDGARDSTALSDVQGLCQHTAIVQAASTW